MLDNFIKFKNYRGVDLNFKENLSIKDSFIFINCSNFNIIIENKINKILLQNCHNFNIIFRDTISGIDIDNSKDISLKKTNLDYNDNLSYLNIFNSKVSVFYDNINNISDFMIDHQNSVIEFKQIENK